MLGIPAIFLFTSVMTASVDMWQFWTLSYAVNQTARYTALHGAGCSANSNSCTVTRANIATFFEGQAIALTTASTVMNLNDGSGAGFLQSGHVIALRAVPHFHRRGTTSQALTMLRFQPHMC